MITLEWLNENNVQEMTEIALDEFKDDMETVGDDRLYYDVLEGKTIENKTDLNYALIKNGDESVGVTGYYMDKTDPDASDSNSTDTDTSTDTTTTTTSTDSGTEQVTIEVPVTTYEDALSFGLGQWYKLQRDNGHTIECKVIGSNLWRVGRWCKVYLPVYSEYCDMYVNRANHSLENGAWTTSLELTPAPACIKADDSTTEETQTPSTDSDTNSSTDSNTDTEDTDTTDS